MSDYLFRLFFSPITRAEVLPTISWYLLCLSAGLIVVGLLSR